MRQRLALAVLACVGLAWAQTGPAQATTVSELNAFPVDVHNAAVRLAIYVEIYRLRQQGRDKLANCILNHFGSMNAISDGITATETILSDPTRNKEAAELIIAQQIRNKCFGNDESSSDIKGEHFLLVKDLFIQFTEDEHKVSILASAINTQTAFDILNEERDRGHCISSSFLAGESPVGFGELANMLHKQRDSPDATVERDINEFINKYCGPDSYDQWVKFSGTVDKVLKERSEQLDREIAEEAAKLAEMRRHASRLPDGRSIFRSRKTGEWHFEDGTVVPEDLARRRISPPPEGWPQ